MGNVELSGQIPRLIGSFPRQTQSNRNNITVENLSMYFVNKNL